jgi:hypothetical protein
MFTLLVCTDVCGVKINLELQFPRSPSTEELASRIDAAFYEEVMAIHADGGLSREGAELLRESSAPPAILPDGTHRDSGLLSLNRVQIYDDEKLRWVDLAPRHELREFDQLYVFPRSRRHLSTEKDLPPPRPPTSRRRSPARHSAPGAAAVGGGSAADSGATTPTMSHLHVPSSSQHQLQQNSRTPRQQQTSRHASFAASAVSGRSVADDPDFDAKARFVFAEADRDAKGVITWSDWQGLFDRTDIRFTESTLDDLFRLYAAPPASYSAPGRTPPVVMQFSDFTAFCEVYPATFLALHARLSDRMREDRLHMDIAGAKDRAVARRRREEELRAELEALKTQSDDDARLLRAAETDMDALRSRRAATEEEEQLLLEKEVRVKYQREVLQREEAELAEAARRFEARHASTYAATSGAGALNASTMQRSAHSSSQHLLDRSGPASMRVPPPQSRPSMAY